MNTTPPGIRENIEKRLIPYAQQLRNEGVSDINIQKAILDHIKIETKKYYSRNKGFQILGDVLKDLIVNQSADSKIETIFYDSLQNANINFKFQVKIGKYRVDYLVEDFLIIEIDGPIHDKTKDYDKKRDEYLKSLGYKIIRVPISYLIINEKIVIESIREIVK